MLFKALLSDLDFAIGGLAAVFVEDNFTDFICRDVPGSRILNACDFSFYRSLYGRIFKHQVGVFAEGAVFEHEAVDVAQQLLAG